MRPLARKTGLSSESLPSETVIYDRVRHKAHCLNRTVSFVWQSCDGSTTVEEIARRLPDGCGVAADSGVVLLALRELRNAHLLEEDSVPDLRTSGVSRRAVAKRLAAAGFASPVLLPLVTSIVAPTPAMAKSNSRHKGKKG